MSETAPPEESPPFGVCLSVFEHWLKLRAESARPDRLPTRDQIDMLTLPRETLPWFFIHQREGDRYLNRLAGTAMVEAIGFETRGRYLDEMMAPALYPERKALLDRCAEQAVCVHYRATLAAADREHVGFSRILFPAASDQESAVDLVCGTMVFFGNAALPPEEKKAVEEGYRGILLNSYFDGTTWRRIES
ncbi:MAG: PAS domain-containing protein [Alphaproteobacteria bacterium]|nr:PAS domain-containing protein [Alphaproteobacteria bacterium]